MIRGFFFTITKINDYLLNILNKVFHDAAQNRFCTPTMAAYCISFLGVPLCSIQRYLIQSGRFLTKPSIGSFVILGTM